ncbi:hypothetical protein OG339_38020 [Streptosporangium sp. NBC_01495]|nr:hypothetical protein [Streptosporangium sp. NBC_01495]
MKPRPPPSHNSYTVARHAHVHATGRTRSGIPYDVRQSSRA